MTEQPDMLHFVRQWVAKAEEDICNAEHSLTLGQACPCSTVCFHAQQCVEKYLKALLVLQGVPFPRTHDLITIYHLLPAASRPQMELADLAVLNRYAVETRYPGDWDPIDLAEAEQAVIMAQNVRNKVRALLPDEAVG